MEGTFVGLDVGFSETRRTSGVARLTYDGLSVGRAMSESSDRERVLRAFDEPAGE